MTLSEKRTKLIQYSLHHQGDWNQIAYALSHDEPIETFLKCRDACITIYDREYPDELRGLRYPPWVLYYQGNIHLLEKPKITIVGSRNLCEYGAEMTRCCAEKLSRNYVLVSGLAKGADAVVHETAVKSGHTIGVIGSGLKYSYPWSNRGLYEKMKAHDLILSEYPHDTGVQKHHFPWRNRILAALGEKIIVTQAGVKSGTMITVNEGLSLSREIWCIPYEYGNTAGEGCSLLISEGAYILYNEEQLDDLCRLRAGRF